MFAKKEHYSILENSNTVTWWFQTTNACCMQVMRQNNGGAGISTQIIWSFKQLEEDAALNA